MVISSGSSVETEYPYQQFTYTTAEIEGNTFFGTTPDPFYFAAAEPPTKVTPIVLTVIDGELREVRNENPPNAKLPTPRLLELAG